MKLWCRYANCTDAVSTHPSISKPYWHNTGNTDTIQSIPARHVLRAEVSWSVFVRPLCKTFDFLLCMHAWDSLHAQSHFLPCKFLAGVLIRQLAKSWQICSKFFLNQMNSRVTLNNGKMYVKYSLYYCCLVFPFILWPRRRFVKIWQFVARNYLASLHGRARLLYAYCQHK